MTYTRSDAHFSEFEEPPEEQIKIFYKSFLSSNDMMIITDKEGTIIDVNPSFERIYGYSKEEVLGKNPRILKSTHSTPELYKNMWENLLEKGYWSGELINVDKLGNEHPVLLSISALRNEKEITHFVGIAVDITEKKSAEERIKELSLFPETNPDIVMKLDRTGNILYMNPAAETLIDNLKISVKELLPDNLEDKIRTVIETGSFTDEKQVQDAYLDYTYAVFPDRKSILLRGKDSTQMKKMARQLKEYSLHLESLVKEKTDILKVLYNLEYHLKDVSLEEGLKIIEESAAKLGFDEFFLFLFDEEDHLRTPEGEYAVKDPEIFRAVKSREPVITMGGSQTTAWVPLLCPKKVLGVCGFMTGRPLTDSDHLTLFSNQVARFVEKRMISVEPGVEEEVKTTQKYALRRGFSYLVEEESPQKSFDVFVDYVTHGVPGLCITRTNPRFVREGYSLRKTPFIWLSTLKTEEYTSTIDLTELSISVKDFIRKSMKGIILLDGVEYLVTRFSFEEVLSFVQSLAEFVSMTDSLLMITLSPQTIDVKQLKLLEREMTLFEL